MAYGTGGVSPRKAMAMGKSMGGSFDVDQYPGRGRVENPDHAMRTGEQGMGNHLKDSERGIGAPIAHSKDHHPAQAAPNHGPGHESKMGFMRDAKA